MATENEIIAGLNSPVLSERLLSLQQMMHSPQPAAVLEALRRRLPLEENSEVQQLLQYMISATEKRVNGETGPGVGEVREGGDLNARWNSAAAGERLSLLRRLGPADVASLAVFAPDWLEKETDYVVATGLIRLFGPRWPRERLGRLRARLRSRRFLEALASLEALIQRDPDSLRGELPRLLQSEDPGARALAVKGLARLDLEAAIEHFEVMLESADAEVRQQALKIGIILPFDRVKPGLFSLLAKESDDRIFDDALLILVINPDQEIPYRLFELAEHAAPERQKRLLNAVKQSCASLQSSGLLAEAFDGAMARLQHWIRERRAARYVRQCLRHLIEAVDEARPDPELVASVSRALKDQPEVGAAFAAALAGPLPETYRQRLTALMNEAAGRGHPGSDKPKSSLDEEIRKVAELAIGQHGLSEAQILERLSEAIDSGKPELVRTAVRTALRLEIALLNPRIEPLLSRQDPGLVSAAIEYSARFSPDALFPRLGTFLLSPHQRVKMAALDALRRSDPTQAVSRLRLLLLDKKSVNQEAALGCLVQFDFALVRRLLAEFLRTNPDMTLFAAGLDIFAAFPDPENLELLTDLSRNCLGDTARMVQTVLKNTETRLCEQGLMVPLDLPKLQAEREQRAQVREERRRAPPSPYTVRAIQQEPSGGFLANLQGFAERLDWAFAAKLGVAGIVLLGLLFWLFRAPAAPVVLKPGQPVALQRLEVSGVLVRVDGEGQELRATVLTNDKKEWVLFEQETKRLAALVPGKRFRFVVNPIRTMKSGVIQANLVDCSAENP